LQKVRIHFFARCASGLEAMEKNLFLAVVIAIAAVAFGIASGRAKAQRMRQLRKDFELRKPAALIIAGGVALYLAQLVIQPTINLFR